MVVHLAVKGENGAKADLPHGLHAVKEYEYLTLYKKSSALVEKVYPFKTGKTVFQGFGTIIVTKTIDHRTAINKGLMVIDVDKLPKGAKWRTRKDGDMFTRYGSGTKTLNAYLIDKKIPARLRDNLPVLALGNEVFAVAGIEISKNVAADRETLQVYVAEFIKD
jgi:tRNA(Ile)-lysidine synthase